MPDHSADGPWDFVPIQYDPADMKALHGVAEYAREELLASMVGIPARYFEFEARADAMLDELNRAFVRDKVDEAIYGYR